MAETPLITFKAGQCTFSGRKVTAIPQPGYIYVYVEDELPHFCWRARDAPAAQPHIDLIIPPGDGSFVPWLREEGATELHSPTNGRIYVLRFESSSQKHFFYLQSKSQHSDGDPSWWSQRDQRVGQIVNAILQGEEIDVEGEIAEIRNQPNGGGNSGNAGHDDEMELDDPDPSTGGAGADATGGDARTEGEASREGGADGGRATEAESSILVQNLLRSLQQSGQQQQGPDLPFTTLPDLFVASTTIPFLQAASSDEIDRLCALLPPDLFIMEHEAMGTTTNEPILTTSLEASTAIAALPREQKIMIITRVLRSPQLQQSLSSLTVAIRDGGLPMIGEALNLSIENAGRIRGGSMPLGGSSAVRAFVEGIKTTVQREQRQEDAADENVDDRKR